MSCISIIGSGFSGLSAACFSAKGGSNVQVFEKNNIPGGRAGYFKEQGFLFETGPSWYWMPDIFEKFFNQFNKSAKEYYQLVKLDPGFQIFFKEKDCLKVPVSLTELYDIFESIEPGSAPKLKRFLKESEVKYNLGMRELVYKPAYSWREFARYDVLLGVAKSNVFKSLRSYVRSFFKDERLIALMEFPVLFLGAMPQQIPALYSLMNYAALDMGTWYPVGGMYKVIDGMHELASSLGVDFYMNSEIKKISVSDENAYGVQTADRNFRTDSVIASADYHHVETHLLEEEHRNYKENYWGKRTMAPSCLIFFVGVNKRIKKLIHHNLFFDTDFETHAGDIYKNPKWPDNPLFYVCCPSKTDPSVAPRGMENLFILIPIAPGMEDTETMRNSYFDSLIKRIEIQCGDSFASNIIFRKSYCINDFKKDYNAYKGNAYGLANTLSQTAFLKPSMRNYKVKNLFYAGQLTLPGPGVPPAIISGQIAAGQALTFCNKLMYEKVI